MELRANQRWLRNRQRELLATQPKDDFMHGVELSVIEGALDDMKTPAGAAEFRTWLRETKARHKFFWENIYLKA